MKKMINIHVGLCLFCFYIAMNSAQAQMNPFITRWNLATAGSGATQLAFNVETSGTISYTWQSTTTSASGSGTFSGTTCTITGLPAGQTILLRIAPTNFKRFRIINGGDNSRLTAIEAWGDVAWTSMGSAFSSCNNLTTATGNPILSGVTDMSSMFAFCWNFNGNITGWNTASVKNMESMFYDATVFNQPIGNWNTAAVTTMSSMFESATNFNQPIGNWNTAAVTNINFMFSSTDAFNQPIGNWNTASVTGMFGTFNYAIAFNQNLGNWTLNANVNLSVMLNNTGLDCSNYSTTLAAWAVQPGLPSGKTLDATGRNYGTDAVAARTTLTTPTASGGKGWMITGDAPSTGACFVPEINVQGNNNNIIDGSTVPSATNHTDFGSIGVGSPLVRTFTIQNTIFGLLTISSITSNNPKFVIGIVPTSIGAVSSATFTVTYTPTATGTDNATIIINNNDGDEAIYDFAITGTAFSPFFTRWNLATAGSGATQLSFGVVTSGIVSYVWRSTTTIANGSGTFSGTTCTITGLPAGETILLSIAPPNFQRFTMNSGIDRSRLTAIEAWGEVAWTSMATAFSGCNNLTTATGNPILTGITDMSNMFRGCTNFNGNITGWNTAAVTTMSNMFENAIVFNQPIGNWNTAAVTNMRRMFTNAAAFNQPIGTWNTTAVTNMSSMFFVAIAFNQPIGNWNTAAVTDMSAMFADATAFNQDIGNWNTSSVTAMFGMFANATAFDQAIGTWNMAAVTNMGGMFQGATAFNQSLGNWTLNANADLSGMLNSCGINCNNYSTTLAAWAAKPNLPTGRTLGASGRNYGTDAVAARTTLTTTKGWTITGDISSGVVCGLVALPVELLSFTGKNEKVQNLLSWKTATETNNEGFDIETSKDGVNFQFLAFVKGRGTTSETQNYTFTHRLSKNESGIQYYRLKQMDTDGKFEYSKIIVVRSEGKQNSIAVYPNPSNGLYTIVPNEKAEIEQISLMSITGQSLDVNMTNNQLDLSNEAAGVYFLQVNGQHIKLIKN